MAARLTSTALHDLYEACAPAAFRRARGLLDTDADAWDAVHEVFCRLAEANLPAAVRARPMAYIYRATTNACLNILQARRVRSRSMPDAMQPTRAEAETIHARDLLEKLDEQLDDLDRQILILSFHDGLPQEQIAEILGIWRRTVGRRLSRLRALVEALGATPFEEDAMNEHASSLELDEVAAGLATSPVRAHVEACDSCRARLAEITAQRKSVVDTPGYQQTLANLPSSRSAPRLYKLAWTGGVGVLAAAALLFIVARPSSELRAKGSASLQVLNSAGQETSTPHAGEQLALKIAAGRYNYALVAALDGSGKPIPLWPSNAVESGKLPPGGHESVVLRVTPGPTRIVAAFSNQPVSIEDLPNLRARSEVEFLEREIRPVP